MSTSDKVKLRNKKTGKVKEFDVLGCFMLSDDFPSLYTEDKTYNSLAEFNEEWEDYTPADPIKDDKMRQCLKLWSEINGFKGELTYAERPDWCSFYEPEGDEELVFRNRNCPNLKDGEAYTIAELCGEEEE